MKNLIFLFGLVLSLHGTAKDNLIDFNSAILLGGEEIHVEYQYQLEDWISVGVRGFGTPGAQSLEGSSPLIQEKYTALGLSSYLFYKMYYFSLAYSFINHELSDGNQEIKNNDNIFSFGLGKQWIINNFSLKMGLELRSIPDSLPTADNYTLSGSSQTTLIENDTRLDIKVGWVF